MNKVLVISFFIILAYSPSYGKRGSTVGDLLKNIEKQAELKKKSSNLPKFSNVTTQQSSKSVNLKSVKPPSTAKMYYDVDSDEAQLLKITDAGINQLFKLTQKFKNSSKRGELWLRLAELYVEKARLIEYSEYNKFDKQMALYEEKKIKTKPKVNLSSAKEYNKKAIQLYEWFLRDFPKDDKVPQALFFLGYNYFEIGQVSKGRGFYEQLSSRFPKSIYVDESNFALAEHHFDNDNWKEAEKYYRKVTLKPRSRLYAFAMYKAAWSIYKQGKFPTALKTLEKVILHGRKSKGSGDKSESGVSSVRLASEALNDLVIFYAEAGNYKDAYEYFSRVTGLKTAPVLYERLGNFYMDRGARNKATDIFKDLVGRDPLSPKSFELQYKIVSMYSSAGNSQIFKEELFFWIERYGPGSAWQKSNAKNKELVSKSEMLAEATLRNYTLQNHQTAQNSRAKFSQDMAQRGYDLYFTTFPTSSRSDEMHFFYGELLFDMKKFTDSAIHYMWIVENSPKSPYFDQALINAILSVERQLPTNAEIKSIVGENTNPIEFDRTIKNFEKLSKLLFEKSPKNSNNLQIKYKLGTLYYYYNQFPPALAIFNEVINESPNSKFAEYSANLILDIYNLQKDYEGLEVAADNLLKVPGLQTSNIGKQIKGIKQRSAFKRAENLESSKSHVEAANSYLKFAKDNPGSDLVTSAYYNAGINYEKGLAVLSAIGMYEVVAKSKDRKNENLSKNSRKFLGPLYEKIGKYREAAEAYEVYAKQYPKDADSLSYIFNAAVLREAMQHYTAAINGYQDYFSKSKKTDRWETLFYIAKIWEQRKKYSTAVKFYEQYVNSPSANKSGIIEALYRLADLNQKMNKLSAAQDWHKKTIRIFNNFKKAGTTVGARFASQSEFSLIYPKYLELVKLKIPENPAQQGKVVQTKLNLLTKLREDLKTVIRYDDADQIVAALTVQGQGLQHMAAALYSAPLPKGLDAEQTKMYKAEVEKLAKPLKDQAIESYKAAINRGYSLGGYGPWLKVAINEMSKLEPGSHLNNDEKVYYITRVDSMGDKLSDNLEPVHEQLAKDDKDLKALNTLGIYYLNKNEPGLAKLALEKAVSYHPKSPSIYNNLGVIEIKDGDQRKAIVNFKQATTLQPNYKPVLTNMSSIYLEYSDYKSAIGPIEDSYNELKGDLSRGQMMAVQAASNYAVCLTGMSDFKKAKNIYEKILDSGVRDIDVMMNYAILLVKIIKDKTESIKILSKIKFASDDKSVLDKVKDLERELDAI